MMSHQGRSPDNLPYWSRASAAEKKKKSSTANRACSQGCRGVTWALTFSFELVGRRLQLPSLVPSRPAI